MDPKLTLVTLVTREFLFREGEYFPSCHASTVALTHDGVIAACFGGAHEGADDVVIWVTRRTDAGLSKPVRICAVEGTAHWNPVLFRGGEGRLSDELILYFKVGRTIPDWVTYVCTSDDDGVSWSSPRPLVPGDTSGGRGPVKNKPVRLSDGAWLAPRSVETKTDWSVIPDLSTDGGKSWTALASLCYRNPPARNLVTPRAEGMIQPAIWQGADGGVHMLMRSTWGRLWRADSSDNGRSWSDAYATDLPNNNSGIDLDRLGDGTLALCMNPDTDKRTPLCVALSPDDGKTFTAALTLEDREGEYSYPSVLADGQTLHIVYTWRRRNIVYAQIKAETIESKG